MPIKFTNNGVDSSFSGSEIFFKKGWKKYNMLHKRFFSHYFYKKNSKVLGEIFLNNLGVQNLNVF